jgi:hypothetical protein
MAGGVSLFRRSLFALLTIALVGFGLSACASTKTSASSTAAVTTDEITSSSKPVTVPPAPAETKADADKDNDLGAAGEDTRNNGVLDYGHAASVSEQQAIAKLLKHYYAAATAENGAVACTMIYSTLAESVAEDYGHTPPGPIYSHGRTCPEVMTRMFAHFHPQLTLELPKLRVAHVRLVEHHGLAILSFGTLPERQISVAREGKTWKVETVLDSEIP